jgi:allophanate hydrolase subunit 2
MRTLTLDKAGIASTIQDGGRLGTLQAGIAPAGAMDPLALKAGQHCLGHCAGEAAIEIAYGNVRATPSHDCTMIVTGAPAMLLIDNEPIPTKSIQILGAGQSLIIGPPSEGIYSYLHVAGGFSTAPIFDSRSTSPREGIGGLHGGYLRDQDVVPLGDSVPLIDTYRANPGLCNMEQRAVLTLRYVPGYQYDELAPTLIQRLNGRAL